MLDLDRTTRSPNYSSRAGNAIGMLVLHATAGSYGSALSWLCNNKLPLSKRVSAHYLIAPGGHTNELVPPELAAWHAGASAWLGWNKTDIQRRSIGIELANRNDGIDPYPPAQYAAALALSRMLVQRYAIPRSFVVRHLDISPGRKTDPRGFPWKRFMADLFPPYSDESSIFLPRQYRVIGTSAWIRPDPNTQKPHTGTMLGGFSFTVDRIVTGERVTVGGVTSDQWARTPSDDWIWMGALELVNG
jgi:N-acetyl-anhydromuramyl-L-alanine amidase AmpD